MRILFDDNVPLYLLGLFEGHEVATTYRRGWASLQNGRLLSVAEEAGFELLVTMDRNMAHQQSLKGRILSIAILDPRGQSEEHVRLTASALLRRLDDVKPGHLLVVSRAGSE